MLAFLFFPKLKFSNGKKKECVHMHIFFSKCTYYEYAYMIQNFYLLFICLPLRSALTLPFCCKI